ncbi:mannose-6-phosphate isomerase [Spartobacteria bacterium LR76]|nr:mannose-6-phosphate isomerase [Spartobacteria bacterium LR76]
MRLSNYDRYPALPVPSLFARDCWQGWEEICGRLNLEVESLYSKGRRAPVIAVECYPGVHHDEIRDQIADILKPSLVIATADAFREPEEIDHILAPYLGGDDPVFGFLTPLRMDVLLDSGKVGAVRSRVRTCRSGLVLVVGPAATLLVPESDLLVYADMPRWEGQLRQRRNEVSNLGVDNPMLAASLQYKRSFFVDWRMADRVKQETMEKWDFLLDTTSLSLPKLITGKAHLAALRSAVERPFRVVPFFDPGPWGGQWMKEKFALNPSPPNYAWCFDCVPEENSLLLGFADTTVEIPAMNLVFNQPVALLGQSVYDRFGAEFPIRFDLLDTMGGGNLSFQVHPIKDYARRHFGLSYTQDESYYLLDAEAGANVYLGRKNATDFDAMMESLRKANEDGIPFDDERFIARWPAKRHDHFLIPAGTLHCSGSGCMVLEISATPYIFTFKLWDWSRMGLDGKPRPINLARGRDVIDWSWDEQKVNAHLTNAVEEVACGDGWREERTGLYKTQFIESRRHWFTRQVHHHTAGTVNVLNLVEGAEAVVESPTDAFEPFPIHYAETFIVPAAVGAYRVTPTGKQRHATIKAYVRP